MTQLKACARALSLLSVLFWMSTAWAADDDKGYATGEIVLGAENAPVTMIEYASMTCGHCATFHNDTFKALKEKYVDTGKLRFIYREFPLDGLALRAAMLTRCSGEKRLLPMIEVLFRQQKIWRGSPEPMTALAKIGRLGGVSQERFDACMSDQALADVVIKNKMVGVNEHEVNSTPSFVINGDLFPGNKNLGEMDEILAKYLP